MTATRTAAAALVDGLLAHGTRHVYSVAGESYLPVLDALHERREEIRLVTCRHEATAAQMAQASGRLTGRAGVCMVTRGPGATHASIGLHTALQEETPLVLFVGLIERGVREREAFQEFSVERTLGGLAKWCITVEDPERMPELVARALQTAESGRPGPVVVGLPEDLLAQACPTPTPPPSRPRPGAVDEVARGELAALLTQARRPLLWVGGSGWSADTVDCLRGFAERWQLPVVTGFRRKDLFPNDHACYAGELGLAAGPADRLLGESDLVVAVGTRMTDPETGGYSRLDPATTAHRLVHLHPAAEVLGAIYPARLALVAGPQEAVEALDSLAAPVQRPWRDWAAAAHAALAAHGAPVEVRGKVNLSRLFASLGARVGDRAIVTNGAGNYAAWLHRFYRHRAFPSQLAPGNGAMGYGLPAAIAAKFACPERPVICVAGDGCFMMAAHELATVKLHDLDLLVFVVANGSYGTIRMHQERSFPGRVAGTDLANPDFTLLAAAYGLPGWLIESDADVDRVLDEALARGRGLVEIRTGIEDIAPGLALSTLRAAAQPVPGRQ